jgi:hypothetical protein
MDIWKQPRNGLSITLTGRQVSELAQTKADAISKALKTGPTSGWWYDGRLEELHFFLALASQAGKISYFVLSDNDYGDLTSKVHPQSKRRTCLVSNPKPRKATKVKPKSAKKVLKKPVAVAKSATKKV